MHLRMESLTNILNTWNDNMFNSFNLKWTCGKLGAWQELEILYRFQGDFSDSMPYEKSFHDYENENETKDENENKDENETENEFNKRYPITLNQR